jgi:hypothetical protein
MIASGLHQVDDLDEDPARLANEITCSWVRSFEASLVETKVNGARRCFEGNALVRMRATVAHDSYERLVEVTCAAGEHTAYEVRSGLYKLRELIENAHELGIDTKRLADAASRDAGIREFCRFYVERRAQELEAAGDDARKRKKLEDDFTPRLELTVVALQGRMHREVSMQVQYRFDEAASYSSRLTVIPHNGTWIDPPEIGQCGSSGRTAPRECFSECAITGANVLRHLLVSSEISSRKAVPEHTLRCSLSGKRVLTDEAELSAVTRKPVASTMLKTCTVTGKRAEPEHFGVCEFSGSEMLKTELGISQVSGKRYRLDQQLRSSVSGMAGHNMEFLFCDETHQPLTPQEAEKCEATGRLVRPGVLERCTATGKAVLQSELGTCVVEQKRVLKKLLVRSSVSNASLQSVLAVRSISGNFCAPAEAKTCTWSGRRIHPDDVRVCTLTGIPFHVEFAGQGEKPYLQPLGDLLHGVRHTTHAQDRWTEISAKASSALRGSRCRIETAHVSPDSRHLAICVELRTLLGLRVQQAGMLYSIQDDSFVGRIAMGKRTPEGWIGAAN